MKSIYGLLALLLFSGCNGVSNIFEQKSNDTATTIADSITKPATSVLESTGDETVINVEPTLIRPQLFLMMKDVADDDKEANVKQATIFNNLDFILKKYNLEPVGSPAVWRYQRENFYFIEAGIPLAKKLPQPEPGTYYKETNRSKAVVAHFFGKHSLLPRAYDSLTVWLKENHQKPVGVPWEVFTSDAKVMKQKDFLETDVYIESR